MNIDSKAEWKGYTLEELRVKRIVNLTRIEIERTKLQHIVNHFTGKQDDGGGTSLVRKVIGAFDYVDYGVLAFRAIRSAFSIFRRFRHRK